MCGQLKRCVTSCTCKLRKEQCGDGCVPSDSLFMYACRKSGLFYLSCTSNLCVFHGNVDLFCIRVKEKGYVLYMVLQFLYLVTIEECINYIFYFIDCSVVLEHLCRGLHYSYYFYRR